MDFKENYDENHTAIERVITSVKESNITFENFRKYASTIDNNINVVLAQIENDRKKYEDYLKSYTNAKSDQKFKRVSADGLIPVEVFRMVIDMNKLLKDIISWQEMKSTMYYIMYQKLFSLMDDANALTIKKEALQEMREMENRRNEVILETFNNKYKMLDERFDTMIRSMTDAQKNERREMLASFERILNSLQSQHSVKIQSPVIDDKDEDYNYMQESMKKNMGERRQENKSQEQEQDDDSSFDDDLSFNDEKKDEPQKKSVRREVKKTDSSIADIEEKYKDFENEAL